MNDPFVDAANFVKGQKPQAAAAAAPDPFVAAAEFAKNSAPGGKYDPTADMSTPQVIAASAGRFISNLGVGAKERFLEYMATNGQPMGPADQEPWASWLHDLRHGVLDERKMSAALDARAGSGWGEFAGATGAMAALPLRAPAAAIGALTGLLEPTAEGESVAKNTATGGLGGYVGGKIGEHVITPALGMIAKGIRWARGIPEPTPPAPPPLPPAVADRAAAIADVGATADTAALTRAPNDWYAQVEQAKTQGPAKEIAAARRASNEVALKGTLNGMRTADTGPYERAQVVNEAVRGNISKAQKAAGDLYDAAATAPGSSAPVDPAQFWARVQPVIDNYADVLPGVVKTRLQQFQAADLAAGAGEMPAASGAAPRELTVGEMAKLYQLVNASSKGAGGTAGYAAGEMKRALLAVSDTLPDVDAPAFKLFKQATALWRQTMQTAETKPIAALNVEPGQVTPEALPAQIARSGPGDLKTLAGEAAKASPEASGALHDALIDYLYSAATNNATESFSGARLARAMDKIGDARLQQLLSDTELAKLNSLRMASNALTVEPPGSAVNYSNTGSRIANMASTGVGRAVESVPIIGPALNAGLETLAQRRAGNTMTQMLNPDLSALAYRLQNVQPPPTPWLTEGARLGGAAGAGAAPMLSDLLMGNTQ